MTFPSDHTFPSSLLFPGDTSRDITMTAALRPNRFRGVLAPARFVAKLGAAVPRRIRVAYPEFLVAEVAEVNGADMTTATLLVSLGTESDPGDEWLEPDEVLNPTTSTATVSLLVGVSFQPEPGTYWAWVRVADSPELVPVRCSNSRVTIS